MKAFLEAHDKLGVEGIDTRALTRRIRLTGAMRGVLSTETEEIDRLLQRVRAYPGLVGRDLVKAVTCRKPYLWKDGAPRKMAAGSVSTCRRPVRRSGGASSSWTAASSTTSFATWKSGAARSWSSRRRRRGRRSLPCGPTASCLSNGPGDPAALPYIVEAVRSILGKVPIFGICLGHQILGQAAGGRTAKLKFGHHGINQPVKNRRNGRVEITSQNHGFVVLPESLTQERETILDNLNDHTSEGLRYPALSAFSVQHHPEAAPGPARRGLSLR